MFSELLTLEELQAYHPPRNEPVDFDAFWQRTLTEASRFPLAALFKSVDYGLQTVESFDITFKGYVAIIPWKK